MRWNYCKTCDTAKWWLHVQIILIFGCANMLHSSFLLFCIHSIREFESSNSSSNHRELYYCKKYEYLCRCRLVTKFNLHFICCSQQILNFYFKKFFSSFYVATAFHATVCYRIKEGWFRRFFENKYIWII